MRPSPFLRNGCGSACGRQGVVRPGRDRELTVCIDGNPYAPRVERTA